LLQPKSSLGPYEIAAPIGAGGMGEVYRATDTRLGRAVAVKVLPEALAEDRQALARFESEARAVAALSHPNILSIFDFGRADGIAYAVTELLEGNTLRERLADGPLPLRKAIDLAGQAARGLAAAHEKGIVHRDLKPENLFVTSDGRLKILDFGLAKVQPAADPALSRSPTVGPLTEPGAVLGTVGYMAPEQVRGLPADARSDIFSLGVVLLELVTGRRPFQKETAAETMTAILREEPAGLSEAAIPPPLERLIRHCLEKNPGERFRSAQDLSFALEAAGGTSTGSSAAASPPGGRSNRRRSVPYAAAGAVALAVAAFFAGRSRHAAAPTAGSLAPVSFQQLTDAPGVESYPSLSPDGKSVVYVARAGGLMKLYLMRVGGRNSTPLTADSGVDDWQPAFSPDGERIAFRSERDGGGIFVMGSTGESVRRLTDFGFAPSWSPDGREVVVTTGTYLFPSDRGAKVGGMTAVDVETGHKRVVSQAADAMQPAFSPHGKRIAFWGLRGDSGQRDIFTVAADGSEATGNGKDVTNDAPLDWSPAWSPDGRWLWFSSNRGGTMNLWRVPIDENSGRVLGAPEPMTTPSLWSGEISFSRDGKRMAYSSLLWKSTLLRVPFDPREGKITGPPTPILKSTQPIRDHDVSPDGRWVAFMQTTNQEDIALARTDGTDYRRLTDDPFRDRGPQWSPDGKEIVFYSDRNGSYQVWTIHPDGSGLRELFHVEGAVNFPIWSPDGSRMAFSRIWFSTSGGGFGLADLRSGPPPSLTYIDLPELGTSSYWPTSWSSDGTKLAGVIIRRDGSTDGIGVYDFREKKVKRITGDDPFWRSAVWLSDGRRLVMRDRRGISLVDVATGRITPLLDVGGYFVGISVGVSSGEREITYTETATEGDVWLAELK
jgi:serine/threonine protein kinase/Tol biopolymer transport system component